MERHRDFAPGELLAGTVYRVVRWLGAGRTGTVYEVEDTTVGRHYVLKTLTAAAEGRRTSDLAARIGEEARALSVLSHVNIVEVVTAGVTSDERQSPFFVMPLLVGRSVRGILEARGALPLETAYGIAIDLLDALAHAHGVGLVHRDVRPENVFIHRNVDGTYVTKLLDFGLARLHDDASPESASRGWAPSRYGAPEQTGGALATPQSDIYAAGVVLFEMIIGAPPLEALADDDPRFPPELSPLLASAVAADPSARPASARAFGDALRSLLKSRQALSKKRGSKRPLPPRRAEGSAPRITLTHEKETEVDAHAEAGAGAKGWARGRFPAYGVAATAGVAFAITVGVVAQTWRAHPHDARGTAKPVTTEVSLSALGAPLPSQTSPTTLTMPLPAPLGVPSAMAPDAGKYVLQPPSLPSLSGAPSVPAASSSPPAAAPPHGPVRAPKHRPRR